MKVPYLIMGVGVLMFSLSCSKSTPKQPTTTPVVLPSIMEVVKGNSDFSLLQHALEVTELDKILDANKNLTVFAPNNAAFEKINLSTSTAIEALDKDELTKILTYHVIGEAFKASDLKDANLQVGTLHPDALRLFISGFNKILINNVPVIQADIATANGMIHVVKDVIIPPTQTLAEIIVTRDDLTYVLSLATATGLADDLLDGSKYFTVFAPNDAAFLEQDLVLPTDSEEVKNILLAHLTSFVVFSGNIVNNLFVDSFLPNSQLLFSIDGSDALVQIRDKTKKAKIVDSDYIATNGILHVIDKVLEP